MSDSTDDKIEIVRFLGNFIVTAYRGDVKLASLTAMNYADLTDTIDELLEQIGWIEVEIEDE
jgi:hypothetical protein